MGYLQKLDKSAIPNIVNLEATLASPAWDPNRDYSLPWQSYITGLGYDPKKVGGELTSVEQLLDPALKGKITMLDSMEDTAALFILEMGGDPANPDEPQLQRDRREKLKQAVDDGQIRQFTGNDYTGLARRSGDAWASIAWSGDIIILQPDNPNLEFRIPDAGGMSSVDTMVIPTGGDVYTASTFMNFFYDPKIAAEVTAYVNYITPVKRDEGSDREDRPDVRRESARLPDRPSCSRIYTSTAPRRSRTSSTRRQWQAVIGV